MMKSLLKFLSLFLLCRCSTITVPQEFSYKAIDTSYFKIASWQKITAPNKPYKIYIEGDGYAFNSSGYPTQDPTPKGKLMRELAFGDNSPNVIYLARPCQYIKTNACLTKYWTTARFAPEVVNAEFEAIKKTIGNSPAILIGFSGGAQIAGLVASAKKGLNITKIITIAGNLNHSAWTELHNLSPLNESMNLENYREQFIAIPQIHYAGTNDKVIPPHLIKNFVGNNITVIMVNGATHNSGWENIYKTIHQEI